MSGLATVSFIVLFCSVFFSETIGKAVLYSYCLMKNFDKPRSVLNLGVFTIFFDIYYSISIGLTFLSCIIIINMVKKFEAVLTNLLLEVRIHYLFLIVCLAELGNVFFTILLGGTFHFYSHFVIVIESIVFYYILKRLRKHVRGW